MDANKLIAAYQAVHHVFLIKFLYTNCTHEQAKSIHELAPVSDSSNMDYKILHHTLYNDAYEDLFAQNSFYSRDNTV